MSRPMTSIPEEQFETEEFETSTLEADILHLRDTAHFLRHRLDSVQRLLDQETFELEKHPARVLPNRKGQQVRKLLQVLDLQEEGLTIGNFLRALNKYLVTSDLVDLNDLQIAMTPLLCSAFQKPAESRKLPYSYLLLSLPLMFH